MNRPVRLPPLTPSPDGGPRSQIATLLLLNCYAAAGSVFVSRAILKALESPSAIGSVGKFFRITNPFALILDVLPGASTLIMGQLNLADVTLVIGVILFPLGYLGLVAGVDEPLNRSD